MWHMPVAPPASTASSGLGTGQREPSLRAHRGRQTRGLPSDTQPPSQPEPRTDANTQAAPAEVLQAQQEQKLRKPKGSKPKGSFRSSPPQGGLEWLQCKHQHNAQREEPWKWKGKSIITIKIRWRTGKWHTTKLKWKIIG